ncbi:hypothetical protein ACFWY9_09990 [Amycolatopsis sp. NPDC059027]|uniref:hypothetical protein n=1 Tax=Amycolatopsis sp. NPDC059027 TaxID=3346709 RepID=UPI00366DD2EB
MKAVEAFTQVVESDRRTTNTLRILREFFFGAAVVLGELCAMVAFLSHSPLAGTVIGLLTAAPGAGVAVYSWRKRRRAT